MMTAPAARPPAPSSSRPGAPAGPGNAPETVTIDPIKLVKKYKWLLGAAGAAGVVLGVVSHFVLLKVYPTYVPEVYFECYAQSEDAAQTVAPASFEKELQRFMATQVQVMLSDSLVMEAVQNPDLPRNAPNWYAQFVKNGSFNPAIAARELKEDLSAGVVGETNFIRMSFAWRNPDDATAILRLLTATYNKNRRDLVTQETSSKVSAIRKSVEDLRKEMDNLTAQRERMMREDNVTSLEDRQNAVQQEMQMIQAEMVGITSKLRAAAVQLAEMQAEVNSGTGITYSDRIRAAVDNDYVLVQVKEQLSFLEGELRGMRQRGIGTQHKSYIELENRVKGIKDHMEQERERLLRQYFDAEMDGLASLIAQLQAQEAEHMAKIENLRKKAADIAQGLAKVKDLTAQIDHISRVRTEHEDTLKNLQAMADVPSALRAVVYQPATRPDQVSFPKIYIMVPLGVIVVLGLAVGTVVLIEVLDQRVKSAADVAMIPRTRVLGIIPHASEDPAAPQKVETVFRDQPAGVMAENFRQLRTTLLKRLQQSGHKSLAVVAGMPGSGGTSVVVNLAHAIAAAEQRVLLIDANFRRPTLHRILGVPEAPGLAEVLDGSAQLQDALRKTDDDRIDMLPAGSADHRRFEGLGTESFSQLLRAAANAYDVILIDVAPAVVAGDAVAVANRCDASLLVVRAMGEKRGLVARLRNELSECRAEFTGVIVNGVRAAAGGYLRGNILATHNYQQGASTR